MQGHRLRIVYVEMGGYNLLIDSSKDLHISEWCLELKPYAEYFNMGYKNKRGVWSGFNRATLFISGLFYLPIYDGVDIRNWGFKELIMVG